MAALSHVPEVLTSTVHFPSLKIMVYTSHPTVSFSETSLRTCHTLGRQPYGRKFLPCSMKAASTVIWVLIAEGK